MGLAACAGLLCAAASAAALVASGSAAAAPKPITGKLDRPGFTVIAVAPSGRTSASRTSGGGFRVRPRGKSATLHLRAPNGVYAGPLVVRTQGRRAILGVKAGTRLGRVVVQLGYARLARRLSRRRLDTRLAARARRGIPIGAGRFGRVRSRPPRRPPPGDRDKDGIPDALDIDDDGDLVLDRLERGRRARRAQRSPDNPLALAAQLHLPIDSTANVNAGSTAEQIDAGLPLGGFIQMDMPLTGSVELDCGGTPNPAPPPPLLGGLRYCSHGGTGEMAGSFQRFPDCCDSDNDGYGILTATEIGPDFQNWGLYHRATSSEIGTGDVLIQRITTDGVETQLASKIQYVFATVPALVSYDDGGGTVTISYPVPRGGPGTRENPFVVGAPGSADVILTLTFWRPQRRPIPPETDWIDMGGLDYAPTTAIPNDAGWCPPDTHSEEDANLIDGGPEPGTGFRDTAADQPASRANTLSYQLNLTRCAQANGKSFNSGDVSQFKFEAFSPQQSGGSAGVDNTAQTVWFKRR